MIAERAAKIVRLKNEGHHWREIGRRLGVSASTVQKHGKRAGAIHCSSREIARQGRERALAALSLKRRGYSYTGVATKMGIDRSTAIRLVRRARAIDERRRKVGQL